MTPLITDPELVERALAVVARAERLFGDPPGDRPRLDRFLRAGGLDGVAAVPLLFGYLALDRGHGEDLAAEWLDRAIEATSALDDPQPWLATGVAGCGWAAAHVLDRLGSADPAVTDALDASLLEFLGTADAVDAELTLGLAGLGTYFLEGRVREDGLSLVLERLAIHADQLPDGLAWRRRSDGRYNLGIPHGVPGVVAFLAQTCAVGAGGPLARELLDGSTRWLLAQAAPQGRSRFPAAVDPVSGPVGETRLAWCYGDLGIAAVLVQAARALGRADWEQGALDLAEDAAARPLADSGVVDGLFCHGSAGVAHLFARLHGASGRPALARAARGWYRDTIDRCAPGGDTGYPCLLRDPPDAPSDEVPLIRAEAYGLAVGVVGVALVLLAGLGRVAPDWDRALGVAVPEAEVSADFARTVSALGAEDRATRLGALAVALGLLAAWGAWLALAPVSVQIRTDQARIEVSALAHPVHVDTAGRVAASSLELDREVRQGEILLELDRDQAVLALREARDRQTADQAVLARMASLEDAQRDLVHQLRVAGRVAVDETSTRAERADIEARFSSLNAEQLADLSRRGFAAEIDAARSEAQAAGDRSQARADGLASARVAADQASARKDREVDIDRLEVDRARLEVDLAADDAAVRRLELELERRTVRSPIDGRLGWVDPVAAGQVVTEGQHLATVIPTGELRVVAAFPAREAVGRVRPGQRATLALEAYPWTRFGQIAGEVRSVGTEPSDALVRVEVAIDPAQDGTAPVAHGLAGALTVTIDRATPLELLLRAVGR